MEIIIVIAVLVAAYLLWSNLTKEVEIPKDLVQTTKLEDDLTAFTTAPHKVPDPAATAPVPMVVPPVVEPVAEKPKRKPAARTVVAKAAAPKKPVVKPAAAKKTVAAKKPAAKKKST